jgi:hypothetical protein
MKKFIFSLILFAIATQGFSQANVYHPVPLQNAEWRTDFFDINCYPAPFNLCSSASYYPDGDTVIDFTSYTKIYLDASIYTDGSTYHHEYIEAIRQDTFAKKIYVRSIINPYEQLLYDFNIGIGDTVSTVSIYNLVVSSIDSVLIGNDFHKRFNFFNSFSYPLYLIEGIGVNGGIGGTIYNNLGWETSEILKCFKVNNVTVLEDSSYSYTNCELFTGLNIVSDNVELKLIPNPVTLNSYLQFSKILNENTALIFYDISGTKIKEEVCTKITSIFLSEDNFRKGIYLLSIKEANQELKWKKLVIQ